MRFKILFAILTCNRLWYFRNCLESIFKFVDQNRIDILVCDNCSVEQGYDSYLNDISQRSNVFVYKFHDRIRNELYRAMNWAIDYADNIGYEFINFVQDDYQWLFTNDHVLDDVLWLMDRNQEVCQVNINMGWKRKAKKLGKIKVLTGQNGCKYGTLLSKRACDNGFTRIAAYDKIGRYPTDVVSYAYGAQHAKENADRYKNKVNGEIWFGRQCKKRGWERVLSYYPNVGMMFDCAYVRGSERFGNYFKPPGEFYLKPLVSKQVAKIQRNHDKGRYSYIEDFCIPDGWEPQTMDKHSLLMTPHKIG